MSAPKAVVLKTDHGSIPAVVLASAPGLAVTMGVGDYLDRFVITHVRSGLKLGSFETQEAAVAAMEKATGVLCWDDVGGPEGLGEHLPAVKAILADRIEGFAAEPKVAP